MDSTVKKIATETNFSGYFCEPYELMMMSGSPLKGSNVKMTHLFMLLPIILITTLTSLLRIALQPFGQVPYVCQMLAGILIGPSGVGHQLSSRLYQPRTVTVLNVFEATGLSYTMFLLNSKVHIKEVMKSGKLAILIGVLAFFLSMFTSMATAKFIVEKTITLTPTALKALPIVAALESNFAFYTILSALDDLKLLTSELGRLALSSALVSCLTGTFALVVALRVTEGQPQEKTDGSHRLLLLNIISFVAFIGFIILVFRPIMKWMVKNTPDGKPLKSMYVLLINMMILSSVLLGEIFGQRYLLGPVIMAFCAPTGPPMGTHLTEKMEFINSSIFMPCFMANLGRMTDTSTIHRSTFVGFGMVILASMVGRSIAVVIPALMFKLPVQDMLSLCLILNCRGIIDTFAYAYSYRMKLINEETLAVLLITAVMRTALAAPLVKLVYDPSRRFISYRRRTIQHNRHQYELRILACIHETDGIPTIVNFLDASTHPKRTIALQAMKLDELLQGHMPQLIVHSMDRSRSVVFTDRNSKADLMISTLLKYEQQKYGKTHVKCFSVVAPFTTINNDISLMAFQCSSSLIIIPVQRLHSPFVKVVRAVLQTAPCSVGILYDRALFADPRPIFSRRSAINTCVIFVGGQDDREALAYGQLMAENDLTTLLRVIRLLSMDYMPPDLLEEHRDLSMIEDFRNATKDMRNVEYLEKTVSEGSETAKMLNAIGSEFDLIVTGRRHDLTSPVLIGLSEWSEVQELGVIGDLLASSDYLSPDTSIFVLQQQASVVHEMIGSPRYSDNRKTVL